jgi:carboxymethylenebutenolidase
MNYPKFAGTGTPGYLNDSAAEGRPAMVIVHEWWGLNAHIRGVVDRFANEGYLAFGADLYRGKLPQTVAEAQQLVAEGDKAQWMADLEQVVMALAPRKVGVVGFSMGAAFALSVAARVPDVRACVAFYGVPRPEVNLTKTQAKVLGHYVGNDAWVPAERLDQVEAELRRASVPVTVHRYDAQHSFFDERRNDVHSPDNAKLAWERTLAFLKDALG